MAGLLISEGMIKGGIEIVKAVRNRHRGDNRNPWNEFECGSNYARSMASYALIPIFCGFEFDLPNKEIGFNPIVDKDRFKCIWSLETGWGYVKVAKNKITVRVLKGMLDLERLKFPFIRKFENLKVDGKSFDAILQNGILKFDEKIITKSITLYYE